jgi:hypothetical protein
MLMHVQVPLGDILGHTLPPQNLTLAVLRAPGRNSFAAAAAAARPVAHFVAYTIEGARK